jgi:hypothetical protein
MGIHPLYGNKSCMLLWAHSQAVFRKITVSGISNCLNYCVIFVVYTQFTSVAMGRTIQPGGLNTSRRVWSGMLLILPLDGGECFYSPATTVGEGTHCWVGGWMNPPA